MKLPITSPKEFAEPYGVRNINLSSRKILDVAAAAQASQAQVEEVEKAVAILYPTRGGNVHGIVTFTKQKTGVRIVADIEGLSEGKHGFHVHQFGDCSSQDAESAGGHFNPTGQPHGSPSEKARHIGDLGNITAGAHGKAHYETTDAMLTLTGTNSMIGRSLIVHANPDDFKTQPTGNAGGRVACGVIGISR